MSRLGARAPSVEHVVDPVTEGLNDLVADQGRDNDETTSPTSHRRHLIRWLDALSAGSAMVASVAVSPPIMQPRMTVRQPSVGTLLVLEASVIEAGGQPISWVCLVVELQRD
jgi:hypothetical protein